MERVAQPSDSVLRHRGPVRAAHGRKWFWVLLPKQKDLVGGDETPQPILNQKGEIDGLKSIRKIKKKEEVVEEEEIEVEEELIEGEGEEGKLLINRKNRNRKKMKEKPTTHLPFDLKVRIFL